MTYALVIAGQIVSEGALPAGARRLDTGEWVTPPGGTWDPLVAAACGYLPVTDAARPADTDTHTHDRTLALVDGTPVAVWVQRAWTEGEASARQAAAADAVRAAVDRAILDAIRHVSEAAHEDGAPWVQPVGAHDAYPAGSTVTHGGSTWESLIPANVWAPGVSGWREVVAEGYPAWVQPTGAHDAYNIGDRVSFEGANYESLIDGNTWSPTDHPAGWQLVP